VVLHAIVSGLPSIFVLSLPADLKSLQASKSSQLPIRMADPVTAAVAVGWGMKAAGWLASPIISELVKRGSAYLGFDASKKLEELETKLLLLERVMEAVEESPYRPRLEQLFSDLKSAFYEAEDILDDVEYRRLQRQIRDSIVKSDGDAPLPRKRDWVQKKLKSLMPTSSPQKNQVQVSFVLHLWIVVA
jgi:hypothetical protein